MGNYKEHRMKSIINSLLLTSILCFPLLSMEHRISDAVKSGDYKKVVELLKTISRNEVDLRNPLGFAIIGGDSGIVKALLDAEAEQYDWLETYYNFRGETALTLAARANYDNPRITQILIACKGNCNLANKKGETPIEVALKNHNWNIAQCLKPHTNKQVVEKAYKEYEENKAYFLEHGCERNG